MNFLNVLRKEFTEQWRTRRLLIVAAVLVSFGLASPLLAKLIPDVFESVPGLPEGFADLIPEPSLTDAVSQYVKNMSQFGILLALLMSMGSVAQEKERGTAAMAVTNSIPHSAFLLAKFTALAFTFFASLAIASLGCWYYTYLLFGPLPWVSFLALNGMILLVFLVYIAVTILCSTLARSQTAAAGLAFCALILVAGVGSLPRISEYFPGRLFSWGSALVMGGGESAWPAFWISLGAIAVALLAAWLVFRRQEL